MNRYRFPIGQNQLIIVQPRIRMSFYTNPASCISVAVFDRREKKAALTHTLNPSNHKTAPTLDRRCSPEDYLKRLPAMAKEKRNFLEEHFGCILEYHSCDKASYTDESIQYLFNEFGRGEHIEYNLIGGASNRSTQKIKISLKEIFKNDHACLSDLLKIKTISRDYVYMSDLNVVTALIQVVRLRLNLVYADICGGGHRMFDFFCDTGEIVYSPKTKVRNPVLLRKNDMMNTQIRNVIKELISSASRP